MFQHSINQGITEKRKLRRTFDLRTACIKTSQHASWTNYL